jgi:cell division protein FtsB
VFHALKKVLVGRKFSTGVGDEGGFAPDLKSDEDAIKAVVEAIEQAGYSPGRRSPSPSTARRASCTRTAPTRSRRAAAARDAAGMIDLYAEWIEKYPIVSIEDGLAEDDWDGWAALTERLGERVQLVGDDLFVTSSERLMQGIEREVGNSILIKVNQIGTLTETLEAIELARRAGTRASSRTARARPRTRSSPTSRWPPTPGRSRPARRRARTGWPSTTSSFASRSSSARPPSSPPPSASARADPVSAAGRVVGAALVLGGAAFAVQGGEYATTDLYRQTARRVELVAEVDTLRRAVDSLRLLERRLRTDPALQERVAREEFGMVRGDRELLYRFADPRPAPAALNPAEGADRSPR